MKLRDRKHNNILKIMIVIMIVCISLIYNYSGYGRLISVFRNNNRELPIYCVDTPEKKIAISFDAAWGADYTESLLKILKNYDVKSTFFLVGFWVDKYPEMVKRIDEEGHEIGNHSLNHPHMSQLSKEQIVQELTKTSEKIEAITNKKVTLFRPPFGDYNNRLVKTSREMGIQVIQWDVDSLDYKDYGADAIVKRVLSKVKNGSIVLFHNNATYTKDALPVILENLQKENYKIVPVSELIYKENYYIDHTGMQKLLR
ncbi:MAG: polysaccharide deacetylase family sporulation protein PdaB [Gracilibacteraceae bacterium]|jgi:polysaccharide deacetylase family sporulation protein PdaB|nr:polysaccharide deacetylase family sporulation protein PdaB [Gracilibacteraceae bacterium]